MECFIVLPEDVDLARNELMLRGEEAHHAIRSLRLHAGDELLATNLIGACYQCRIEHSIGGMLTCSIEQVLPNFGEPKMDVLLIAAIISQPARWEFLLEKATELGVKAIEAIQTERTEPFHPRLERSKKILRAAVKQTKRAWMPALIFAKDGSQEILFRDAMASAQAEGRTIIVLHEEAPPAHSIVNAIASAIGQLLAIVVGPEGGFTTEEVRLAKSEFSAHIVSLGPRRLRAETASLAALSIAMSHQR